MEYPRLLTSTGARCPVIKMRTAITATDDCGPRRIGAVAHDGEELTECCVCEYGWATWAARGDKIIAAYGGPEAASSNRSRTVRWRPAAAYDQELYVLLCDRTFLRKMN
ncbi:hypothetical protein GCM10027269_33840 [Kribbella endophytica]